VRKRILAVLAVVSLALGMAAPAHAETGNSGDNGCTTSNYSGNTTNGSWTRSYNANCANATVGSIEISWHNYDSIGTHYIKWTASISTGAISGNDCLYVALDWKPAAGGHSDSQTVRNCKENSVYAPAALPEVLPVGLTVTGDWLVKRLQIGIYDPDTANVYSVVCPNGSNTPLDTNSLGDPSDRTGCLGWQQPTAPTWNSKAAKIYRRANDGTDSNNDPTYPNNYDRGDLISPSH
jgi:hypothetical protein